MENLIVKLAMAFLLSKKVNKFT
jgi:hypothetical protein